MKFLTGIFILGLCWIVDSILQTIPYGTKIAWILILTFVIYKTFDFLKEQK